MFSLKDKTQVYQANKHTLLKIKGQGFPVNYLRLDNAGEHSEIDNLCNKLHITTEFTAPHTPQHNGIVERRFYTDLRRAQAMMEAADFTEGLRNLLRGEAINTATYIGNMCLSSNPENQKTPYENF